MCKRKCNHKNNVSDCQRHTALLLFSYFCFLIMLRISVYFKNYYYSTQIILCKCKLLKGYSFSVNHLLVRMDPFTIKFHNISHSSKKEVVYTWLNYLEKCLKNPIALRKNLSRFPKLQIFLFKHIRDWIHYIIYFEKVLNSKTC